MVTWTLHSRLEAPPFNFDLARAGKKKSHGWFFFSTYNTEMAHTLLEVNASQKDKDFIMAVNWKKAEEYMTAGKGKKVPGKHVCTTSGMKVPIPPSPPSGLKCFHLIQGN
jgi:nitrous oxide reductase